MKRHMFLSKIHGEGKLVLVEPSDEVKDAYLKKSESYLSSAQLLLENERLEEAVSMAYYSMYYSALALLFKAGIKCENHSAAIILCEKAFGIDTADISEAKRERVDKQYYVEFSITAKDVKIMVRKAEIFNAIILDRIERLDSKAVRELRVRVETLWE